MELVVALGVLMMAALPLVSLQVATVRYSRRQYRDAVVREMLNDRLTVLRRGGWREHGLCREKKIAPIGDIESSLPEGDLLLSIKRSEKNGRILDIILVWQQPGRRGKERIKRKTAVHAGRVENLLRGLHHPPDARGHEPVAPPVQAGTTAPLKPDVAAVAFHSPFMFADSAGNTGGRDIARPRTVITP